MIGFTSFNTPEDEEDIRTGVEQKRLTIAMCGGCDHDFFGPRSCSRKTDLGYERVCGKCGAGAMASSV